MKSKLLSEVGMIWFLSIAVSIPQFIFQEEKLVGIPDIIFYTMCTETWSPKTKVYYALSIFAAQLVFPTTFLVISFVKIRSHLKQNLDRILERAASPVFGSSTTPVSLLNESKETICFKVPNNSPDPNKDDQEQQELQGQVNQLKEPNSTEEIVSVSSDTNESPTNLNENGVENVIEIVDENGNGNGNKVTFKQENDSEDMTNKSMLIRKPTLRRNIKGSIISIKKRPIDSGTTTQATDRLIEDDTTNTSVTQGIKIQGIQVQDERQRKKILNEIERNTRVTNTLLYVLSEFLLCWLPWNTINIYVDFSGEGLPDDIHYIMLAVCHIIAMSSSTLNALLYGFTNQNINQELRKL